MDVQQPEIDPDFEPQQRARCNTWPCRPREVAVDAQSSPVSDESTSETHAKNDALGLNNKKTSSRRNAWGNLSYADLITKAIQSSPDHRLTLSQIYDWMVQNVPYFKDKGDNTSSAGWKNSIRHNLSLHSRFMRIQNEGTGKSSWWVINPDAKPGKTPRRRAGSMETKSYEKRRGRVKKKVEALRAALENSNSPSSTTDDYLDSPLSFQLSPDFRPRASSNASSCGRLSPIQAGIEPDLHDNQVPPMSPIPWGQELDTTGSYDQMGQYDKLVDTLVDSMKLGDATIPMGGDASGMGMGIDPNDVEMLSDSHGLTQQLMNSSHGSHGNINESLTQQLLNSRSGNIGNAPQYNDQSANYDDAQYGTLPAPPAYPGDSIRRSPQQQQQQQQGIEQLLLNGSYGDLNQMQQNNMRIFNNQQQQPAPLFSQEALLLQQTRGSPSSSQLSINTQQQQLSSPSRSPQTQISPNYGNMGNYSAQQQQSPQNNVKQLSPQQQMLNRQQQQQQQQQQGQTGGQPSLLQRCLEAPPESLLRAALTQKAPQYQITSSSPSSNQSHYNNMGYTTSQHQGQQLTNLRPVPPQPMNSNGINNNILSSPQQQQQQQQNNRTLIPNLQQHMSSQNQMTTQMVSSNQLINTETLASNNSGNSLNEIDADFFDLGCDMEKVLQQELSLEGNLDFNFDPSTSAPGSVDAQNLVR